MTPPEEKAAALEELKAFVRSASPETVDLAALALIGLSEDESAVGILDMSRTMVENLVGIDLKRFGDKDAVIHGFGWAFGLLIRDRLTELESMPGGRA
jgi:hypothetical protein